MTNSRPDRQPLPSLLLCLASSFSFHASASSSFSLLVVLRGLDSRFVQKVQAAREPTPQCGSSIDSATAAAASSVPAANSPIAGRQCQCRPGQLRAPSSEQLRPPSLSVPPTSPSTPVHPPPPPPLPLPLPPPLTATCQLAAPPAKGRRTGRAGDRGGGWAGGQAGGQVGR